MSDDILDQARVLDIGLDPNAIMTVGKVFFRDRGESTFQMQGGGDVVRHLTMIAGVVFDKVGTVEIDDAGNLKDELWECDVIIRPYRRFVGYKFKGHRADQLLTSGGLDGRSFEEEIPL